MINTKLRRNIIYAYLIPSVTPVSLYTVLLLFTKHSLWSICKIGIILLIYSNWLFYLVCRRKNTINYILIVLLLIPISNHYLPATKIIQYKQSYIFEQEVLSNEEIMTGLKQFKKNPTTKSIEPFIQETIYYLTKHHDPSLKIELYNDTDHIYGSYSNQNNVIKINTEYCLDEYQLISTILHECYHYYQYGICDHYTSNNQDYYDLRKIQQWQYEMNHYQNSSNSFNEYYNQSLESTAREFSSLYTYDIWKEIFSPS